MTKRTLAASQVVYRTGFQRIPTEARLFHSLGASYQKSKRSESDVSFEENSSRDSARKKPDFDAFLSMRKSTSRGSRRQDKTTPWTPNHKSRSEKHPVSSSKPHDSVKTKPTDPSTFFQPRSPIIASKPAPPVESSWSKTTPIPPTIESYIPSFSFSSPQAPPFIPRSRPSISKHDLSAHIQHTRSSSPAEPKLPLAFHLPTDLLQAVQNQEHQDSKNLLESLLVMVMSRSHQIQQAKTSDLNFPRQTVDNFSRPSSEHVNTHPIRTADIDALILRILSPAYASPENISLLLNLLPMLFSFAPERSRYMSPKTIALLLFNSSDPIKGFEYLDSQCLPEDQAEMFNPTELSLIWKAWVTSSQPHRAVQQAYTRLLTMGLPANEETFHDYLLGIFLRYTDIHSLKTIVKHLPRDFQDVSQGQPTEFRPTVQDALVRLFDLAEIVEDEKLMCWTSRRICHLSQAEPIEGQIQGVRQEIQTAAEAVVLDCVERWDLSGMRTQISSVIRYFDPLGLIIIPPRWAELDSPKEDDIAEKGSLTPIDLDILDRTSRTWTDGRKGRLWKALVRGSALENGQSWKSVFQVYLLGSRGIHHELQRPDEMIFPVIETLGRDLSRYAGDQKRKFALEVLIDKTFIHILMTTPALRLIPSDLSENSASNPTAVPAALSVQAGKIIQTILNPFLETPVLPQTENKLYDALLESLSRLMTYRPVFELDRSNDALRHLLTLAPSPTLMIRTIRLFILLCSHQATMTSVDDGWSRSIFPPELATETAASILSRFSSTPDVSQPDAILDLIDLSKETVGAGIDVENRLNWLRQVLKRYIEILILLGPPPSDSTLNLNKNVNKKSVSRGKVSGAHRAHQLGEIRNAIIKVERWTLDRPDLFTLSSSISTAKSNEDIRVLIAKVKHKVQTQTQTQTQNGPSGSPSFG